MDTKGTIIGRIVDLGFGHVVRETIQVGPTLQQQLAEMKSRAEKAEAELAGLRADAERLDWLMDAMRGADLYHHIGILSDDPAERRAAIDSLLRVAEGE